MEFAMGLRCCCTLKGDVSAGEMQEPSPVDMVCKGQSLIGGMGILLMALLS